MRAFVAAVAVACVAAPVAAAAAVDRSHFRYARELRAEPGLVRVDPDGALYAHTAAGFRDLRFVDAAGRQVPYRRLPPLDQPSQTRVELLNRGNRAGAAVALIDLGPNRRVHDRIELEIPDESFVGTVVVSGSQDRRAFTKLSATRIYSVSGARNARSTTALFPPTDFRYLQLRATGVSTITGATVAFDPSRPALRPVDAKTRSRQQGQTTIVDIDLGHRNVPVDRIDVSSSTRRFDRPVTVSASNDAGGAFELVGDGRLTRFQTISFTSIPVRARARYIRVEIANGDDSALAGLRVSAFARPRTLLLAPGFRPPYRVFYGDPRSKAPRYDFAAVPAGELPLARASAGRLGRELLNPAFEPPRDTRSFAKRHPAVVQGALALAAVAVAGAGLLALRRRS